MPKSKNVRKQPEITLWKRWKMWLSRNEKILWVGLLILIAPLFAFTGAVSTFLQPGQDTRVLTAFYGKEVVVADLKRVGRFVGALRQISSSALAGAGDLILDGSPDFNLNPYKYLLFKEKAARLGIRVSDAELGQRIQELWREDEATRLAREEVFALPGSTNQQQQMMRFYQLRFEKQKELTDRGAFDPAGWKSLVKAQRQPLRSFEEMLRDFYTIVKLQEYVGSSVKVTPQEVYEEFKTNGQKRLLSWVTWKPPTNLTESISANATDEDLKTYFGESEASYYKPLAVRTSYVIVSGEHFDSEAEKNLTDKDLEDYYSSNRNDYRMSAILAGEATFALRTEEEQKEFEKALFKPFDEVKDDVREKVLESKSRSDLRSFETALRQKLFPAVDANKDDLLDSYEVRGLVRRVSARIQKRDYGNLRPQAFIVPFSTWDKNDDGRIDTGEWLAAKELFPRIDLNRDGLVTKEEVGRYKLAVEGDTFIQRFDLNGDGKVTEREYGGAADAFRRADRNGDGVVNNGDRK